MEKKSIWNGLSRIVDIWGPDVRAISEGLAAEREKTVMEQSKAIRSVENLKKAIHGD